MADDTPFPFPDDLLHLQRRLHRVRGEYTGLCRTLPRSAEPLPGRTLAEPAPGGTTRTVTIAASPGYTPEQAETERWLREQLLELSEQIVTHDFWTTCAPEDRHRARSALKHVADPSPPAATEDGGNR